MSPATGHTRANASRDTIYAPRAPRAGRVAATMSIVHLQNVEILNSEARFSGAYLHEAAGAVLTRCPADSYIFKVTFECIAPLEDGALRGAAPCT